MLVPAKPAPGVVGVGSPVGLVEPGAAPCAGGGGDVTVPRSFGCPDAGLACEEPLLPNEPAPRCSTTPARGSGAFAESVPPVCADAVGTSVRSKPAAME